MSIPPNLPTPLQAAFLRPEDPSHDGVSVTVLTLTAEPIEFILTNMNYEPVRQINSAEISIMTDLMKTVGALHTSS